MNLSQKLLVYLAARRLDHARTLALWETNLRGAIEETDEVRLIKAELRAAIQELDAIRTFVETER